jgi:hypothetical protein
LHAQSQEPSIETVGSTGFHQALIRAAMKAQQEGKIKRVELIRLRLAMMSPAFRQHAEDLAIIQMAASGSDSVTLTDTGKIDRASIDWEKFLAFLEKLIPIILQLIDAFSFQYHFSQVFA